MNTDSTSTYPRLFALLIGINDYPKRTGFDKLKGAVKDAERWRDLLLHYQVPESQVRVLTNKQACRSALLEALEAFKNDERICVGDPILIFYAGHGAEFEPPPNWDCGGPKSRIQTIIPHDYCETEGLEIPSIPDRTIGAILEDIAEKKGNNITVILDCCHSSSGTRSRNNNSVGRARSARIKSSIHTTDLDREVWEKTSQIPRSSNRFRFNGLGSHTLIAACRSGERARENANAGQFSTALLKLLRRVPPNQLRYSELLTKMERIHEQHPQIEGNNLDRYLFDAKLQPPPPPRYFLRHHATSSSWIINAGAAQGITQGARFLVLPDRDSDIRTSSEIVVCEEVCDFSSTVHLDGHWFESQAAQLHPIVQTRAGKHDRLSLYIPPGPNYKVTYERLFSLLHAPKYELHNVALTNDPDLAHVEIIIVDDKARFRLSWQKVAQYGVNPRLPALDASDAVIAPFLESLSRYFWQLDRPSGDSTFLDDIRLSVYDLVESEFPFKEPDFQKLEMSRTGDNLFKDGNVDIVVKDERHFGIKIENQGSRDIYPTLLYFDNADFSNIATCYRPPFSGPYTTEAPLKTGGSLTLGYGSGGMAPLSFGLREDENMAVGFLKLLISTHPLDSVSLPDPALPAKWASLVIPVIQRRYSTSSPRTRPPNLWPMVRTPATRGRTNSMPSRPGLIRRQYQY